MHYKSSSQGKKFKQALLKENPLKIVGVINAYSALQAAEIGFKAMYISGAGVANASYGLPDLAMTSLEDVCIDLRRISSATDLPILVDIDTGFGGAFNISRTVKEVIKAGAGACHIEDQVQMKRCGHRPNKEIVSPNEMGDRIKSAVDGKTDDDFVIMARTDAYANEGIDRAIDRANLYLEAGADMIFAEAMNNAEDYRIFKKKVKAPVLANLTEFGKTPLMTVEELKDLGIEMALYPLSAFRAMNKAAFNVYSILMKEGTQKRAVDTMQTRTELYEMLKYYDYEKKLDKLFDNKGL